MIKLVSDTIDKNDIDRLIKWLQTYPRLTKGPVTVELEKKWSDYLGTEYSVFCNSGSSANLLMLWSLIESGRIKRDAKVVVPALSWATDLAPVIQLNMQPVLCDVSLETLAVDINHLRRIFEQEDPDVLLLVSVLGIVPDMKAIVDLCNEFDVILLEDTCESMGSEYDGNKLGNFGLMSSFSTYFGHHISTIEGGFVSTNDKELYETLISIRSHGWDRDNSDQYQKDMRTKWGTSDFDALYTFYNSGFNVRSTDLQAYIGLTQIDKLPHVCERRHKNFLIYERELSDYQPFIKKHGWISNFAYPVIAENRDKIIAALQRNNIEVRPMICGSMGTQPFYEKNYGKCSLPNASIIDEQGFYLPNHSDMSEKDIILITDIIKAVQ
jgi:CDP-6-deoxy-D-xylo-4-hexulose-3-dehydrase